MCGYGSLIMKHYEPGSSSFCGPLPQASSYSYWDTADFAACLSVCRGRPSAYILQPSMPASSYYTVLLPVYRAPKRLATLC
jgi:hypothetical protein